MKKIFKDVYLTANSARTTLANLSVNVSKVLNKYYYINLDTKSVEFKYAASPAAIKKSCPAIHISKNKNKVAAAYRKLFFIDE